MYMELYEIMQIDNISKAQFSFYMNEAQGPNLSDCFM